MLRFNERIERGSDVGTGDGRAGQQGDEIDRRGTFPSGQHQRRVSVTVTSSAPGQCGRRGRFLASSHGLRALRASRLSVRPAGAARPGLPVFLTGLEMRSARSRSDEARPFPTTHTLNSPRGRPGAGLVLLGSTGVPAHGEDPGRLGDRHRPGRTQGPQAGSRTESGRGRGRGLRLHRVSQDPQPARRRPRGAGPRGAGHLHRPQRRQGLQGRHRGPGPGGAGQVHQAPPGREEADPRHRQVRGQAADPLRARRGRLVLPADRRRRGGQRRGVHDGGGRACSR